MTSRASNPDSHRANVAMVFLVLGVILLLWAWGSWFYRTSVDMPNPVAAQVETSETLDNSRGAVLALPMFLMFCALAVLVVVVGSIAIRRAVLRHRTSLDRQRRLPTSAGDLWASHKPPIDTGPET